MELDHNSEFQFTDLRNKFERTGLALNVNKCGRPVTVITEDNALLFTEVLQKVLKYHKQELQLSLRSREDFNRGCNIVSVFSCAPKTCSWFVRD